MRTLNPLLLMLAVSLVLVPRQAPAQTVATSFEELRPMLKNGQDVVVTDTSGQQIRGKVGDISPSALLLLTKEDLRLSNIRRRRTIPVTMSRADVSEVRRAKSWKQKARIGIGVGVAGGAGLAMLSRIDSNEQSRDGKATVMGIGSALLLAGGGSAMMAGGTLLYRSRPGTVPLPTAPIAERDRQGVPVSIACQLANDESRSWNRHDARGLSAYVPPVW